MSPIIVFDPQLLALNRKSQGIEAPAARVASYNWGVKIEHYVSTDTQLDHVA